jgi:two-component system, OmpR family, response regulator ResD
MASGHILVVDDEPGMLRLVSLYLQPAGFLIESVTTGAEAIDRVERAAIDLVVLDLGLPDIDGYSVCEEIRAIRDVPIVMLTARSEPRDIMLGFKLGADDYVPKPFIPEELVARVQAVLRRSQAAPPTGGILALYGLTVNLAKRTVTIDGREIELRAKEFDLLVKLAGHPDHVFTRNQLLWQVWGYDSLGDTATVDVHIGRLRRKLGKSGRKQGCIRTVWGIGYRFSADRDGI